MTSPAPGAGGPVRAVFFDLGGVILSSPLEAFRAYEARAGLPAGFLQKLNLLAPSTNAWACMERGEIDEAEFLARFEAEARALGGEIDARALMAQLAGRVRPEMVAVVREVGRRYRVACLTNNMHLGFGVAMAPTEDAAAEVDDALELFEHVVESWRIGMRKPEPRFFVHACARMGVAPTECVFLDDLGQNLKPARAMGMRTIKVSSPEQAIVDLEETLGHPVRV